MAGGMSGREGVPLKDRVRPGEVVEETTVSPSPSPSPDAIQHCWVTDRHGRLPALLLEWRRSESGYQGRVVRPVLEGQVWMVCEEWLPAALLDPA